VGNESHHITILDEKDNILYNKKVFHKLNEFTESIKQFKKIEKKEKGEISFALEKSRESSHLTFIRIQQF
jgi:hypothetical protein